MMLPSSNAALAPQQAEQHPLPPLSLCAVATQSRQLLKVLPIDYCCLLVLGIFKNMMELPGGFQSSKLPTTVLPQQSMSRRPSGAAAFSLRSLPRSVQTPAALLFIVACCLPYLTTGFLL